MRTFSAVAFSPKITVVVSAIAVGVAVYFRKFNEAQDCRQVWNRFDRDSQVIDTADGSFPASDPPSSVPTG